MSPAASCRRGGGAQLLLEGGPPSSGRARRRAGPGQGSGTAACGGGGEVMVTVVGLRWRAPVRSAPAITRRRGQGGSTLLLEGLRPSAPKQCPLPSLVDMAGRTRARRKKSRYGNAGWEAYWGYLLLLLLIPAWSNVAAGPGLIGPLFVLGLSLTDAFYFLFLSPGTCRAPREDGGRCRNNASGILLGCWIRDHRWERLKLTVRRERWEELGRRLRADARGLLATLGTCATIASGAAAVITLIIKR